MPGGPAKELRGLGFRVLVGHASRLKQSPKKSAHKPAETIVVYTRPETQTPGLWGKRRHV